MILSVIPFETYNAAHVKNKKEKKKKKKKKKTKKTDKLVLRAKHKGGGGQELKYLTNFISKLSMKE